MVKKAIIIGVALLSLAFVGSAFAMGKKVIVLKGGFMGNITFPHEMHQKKLHKCSLCHHLFPMEEGAIQKGIASGKLHKKEVMKNCEGCHKKMKSEGKTTGPTTCRGCHKK